MEHTTLQRQLAQLAAQHQNLAQMVDGLADKISQRADTMGQHIDEATILNIARKVVQPEVVMNLETKKIHSTSGCHFQGSPHQWTTRCGWRWIVADSPVKYINDSESILPGVSHCDKCRPYLPSWVD